MYKKGRSYIRFVRVLGFNWIGVGRHVEGVGERGAILTRDAACYDKALQSEGVFVSSTVTSC
jgi:hypothetical protein